MSLFKLKNLWSETFAQQQFDERHLSIGKFNDSPVVVLGSFEGVLRVYRIDNESPVQVHLIYEDKMESQIVGVQLVAHPDETVLNTVGVLLYRKFLFISFYQEDHNRYKTNVLQLKVQPSFGICKTPLSLMTVNSTIQYLNPLYNQPIKVSDPIFAFSRSELCLYYADGEQLVQVQSSTEQWRIILGPIRKICLIKDLVIVIGDYGLWEVQNAKINQCKLFDDEISCGTVVRSPSSRYNVILANFQNHLMVFTSDYVLLWAIKTDDTPIGLQIFDEGILKGAMAILNDNGKIQICYAGSELSETEVEQLNEQVDMEQVEQETKRYLQELQLKKNTAGQQKPVSTIMASSQLVKLKVKPHQPEVTKRLGLSDKVYARNEGSWGCNIECTIDCQKQPIENVSICIILPSNFICENQNVRIPFIKNQESTVFSVFCHREKFPYQARVQIVVKYENAGNSK